MLPNRIKLTNTNCRPCYPGAWTCRASSPAISPSCVLGVSRFKPYAFVIELGFTRKQFCSSCWLSTRKVQFTMTSLLVLLDQTIIVLQYQQIPSFVSPWHHMEETSIRRQRKPLPTIRRSHSGNLHAFPINNRPLGSCLLYHS
jgi:hypothetical protein